MAQSSFSLTQTSEQSPDIFINASRLPLSVYLDVNPEIFSRPRLIRLLRTSGADICHNPSAASILLINPETESGRKFVHDWSTDPHKTVLNYGWIQACLRTGRALLETEEWGGFRVLHTSSCIYSEDEGDEDIENGCNGTRSLSTFRSNPTEGAVPPTFSSRSKPSLTPTRPKPRSPNRPSTIEQNVKLSTPSLAYHHPSSSVLEASDSLPAPSPQSKLASTVMLPSPRSGTGVNPQGTAACYHPAPAPRKHTPMGSDPSYLFPQVADIPPLTHLPSQVTGESKSQNSSLATNHPAPQQSPADSFNLLHALNSAFQFQNAASQTLTQLVETMITVAQRQGMDTAVIQNYLASLPMSSSLNHLTLSSTSQLSNTPDLTSSSLREQQEPSGLGTPSENLGQSSSSRPASYEQPLSGKRRRVSPDLPSQAKRVVHTPQLNQPDEASEPVRGVFSVKSGRPILVFVQIDTRGRHEIVHLIKKNGGQITADIPRAAFVILNPRSVSYADLRQEAEESGRVIVQTAFVMESIKQGRLVDPSNYLLQETSSPKKFNRGRRRPSSFRHRRSQESDHEASEAQTSDTVVDAPLSVPLREGTLTPEPPTAVQLKKGYKFTPAEMTYTWTLLRRIISRERRADKMALVKALHNKMPHHPVASWMSTLSRHQGMYEAVRAEALRSAITSRADPPISQQRQEVHHPRHESGNAELSEPSRGTELEVLQIGASLIPAEGDPLHNEEQLLFEEANKKGNNQDAYARDFEALVGFLTSEDADGGGADNFFERLTAKNVCISAPSWPDFLEQHAAAVTEEIERRYLAQKAT